MTTRATELREEFDRAFAAPPQRDRALLVDVLFVRVGEAEMVLRLSEVDALVKGRRIAAAPSRARELLGLSVHRGRILPVYSLAALLGIEGGADPSWMIFVAKGSVGLAFDRFGRHAKVEREAFAPSSAEAPMVGELLRVEERTTPVIAVGALVARIEHLAAAPLDGSGRKA